MLATLPPDPVAVVQKCALVADDDATMRDILYSLLTAAGYTVLLAASGREALTLAASYDASVAIIDLAMRDGNGLQACAALRGIPKWHNVPIIILTHYPIGKALKAALRAGASGFLCKPLVPSELLWCLEAHAAKMAITGSALEIVDALVPQSATEAANMPEEPLPPVGSEWILGLTSHVVPNQPWDVEDVISDLISIDKTSETRLVAARDERPRILVGEDYPPALEMIRRTLESEGCVVDAARGGHAILSMLVHDDYDLILMNVRMSVASGIDVAHSVRALQGPKGSTPIVAITESATQLVSLGLNDVGISGSLEEPVSSETLRRCLLQHLPAKTAGQVAARLITMRQAPDQDTLARVAKVFPPGAMGRFLGRLAESAEEILPLLGAGGRAAEPAELPNRLHNLAGTAGTLGCSALSAAARELEYNLLGSDQIQQFVDTTRETVSAIHAYTSVSHPTTMSASDKQDIGRSSTPALHVLIVDDVFMIREIASSFLRAAGHNVTSVESGMQAITAVAINNFDVVLMDVRMPGMDGLEATRRIRALGDKRRRVPIVALTAQTFTEQVAECRKAGMDDYLSKPFDQDTLLAAVVHAARAGAT
jgi:CheY-like chemotaxis protein/HPt (histidine-containing phosphotransfer) domain-containing protein